MPKHCILWFKWYTYCLKPLFAGTASFRGRLKVGHWTYRIQRCESSILITNGINKELSGYSAASEQYCSNSASLTCRIKQTVVTCYLTPCIFFSNTLFVHFFPPWLSDSRTLCCSQISCHKHMLSGMSLTLVSLDLMLVGTCGLSRGGESVVWHLGWCAHLLLW